MKYAFIDFDGTLVKLKTDHVACKKELGVQYYHEVPKEKYYIIDEYEFEALSYSELILEATKLLILLRKEGYKIVITSRTGRKAIDELVNKYGFITPDLILSRDDVKFLKPDEQHITDYVKNYSKDSIVIGDSWHDSELAGKLGLKYYESVSSAMKELGFRKSLHNDEVYNEELKFLKRFAISPILDIGCGNRRGGDVCIDIVDGVADKIYDGVHLPFKDGEFNSVFFIHSLEHIEDYKKALEKARRVLIKNGMLGIVIPTFEMSFLDLTHKHHWHSYDLCDIISDNGFIFVRKEYFETIFDEEKKMFSVAMVFRKVG